MFAQASRRTRVVLRVALLRGIPLLGVPLAFSYVMTKSYRSVISCSPAPQRVPRAAPQLGWLAACAPGWRQRVENARPSMVVHGLGDSLESYLEHARPLRERGHSVLLVDLRGHGGSEGSYTTLGGRERADVRAAMDELRRRGLAGHGIVLMGHSMGSVAVLLAAAEATDVRGVIVEAPYDTYRNSVIHHAKPSIRLAVVGADHSHSRSPRQSGGLGLMLTTWMPWPPPARIGAPLFAIVDGQDPRMPEAVVRRIYDAHPGPEASLGGSRRRPPRSLHAPRPLAAHSGLPRGKRTLTSLKSRCARRASRSGSSGRPVDFVDAASEEAARSSSPCRPRRGLACGPLCLGRGAVLDRCDAAPHPGATARSPQGRSHHGSAHLWARTARAGAARPPREGRSRCHRAHRGHRDRRRPSARSSGAARDPSYAYARAAEVLGQLHAPLGASASADLEALLHQPAHADLDALLDRRLETPGTGCLECRLVEDLAR